MMNNPTKFSTTTRRFTVRRMLALNNVLALMALFTPGTVLGQVPVKPPTAPNRPTAPAAAPTAAPAASPTFEPNQTVEAREGDSWSPATIVAKEGRKLQIRYGDGTLEWVTADRLRVAGSKSPTSAPPAAPAAGGPATSAAPPATGPAKPPVKEQYAVGAKIEAKWAHTWSNAVVKNRDGDLYLVMYDGWETQFHWQWVHVSMVRNVGDTEKEGPDWADGVTIANSSIAKAKADAVKKFAGMDKQAADRAARKATEKANAKTTPRDPWAPEPLDLPLTPVSTVGVAEKGLGQVVGKVPPGGLTAGVTPRPFQLRLDSEVFFHSKLLFGETFALHVSTKHRMGETPKLIRVERLNLATGVSEGVIEWEKGSDPIAISPTGDRVLGWTSGSNAGVEHKRVDLWELSASPASAKHLVSFEPGGAGSKTEIEWATLVDNTHILTCSKVGEMILWQIAGQTVKAVWRCQVRGGHEVAISPNRKIVAAVTDSGLALLDSATGSALAVINSSRIVGSLQFTSDGKYAVGESRGSICFWDLEKGEFGGEIALPAGVVGNSIAGGSNGYVLLGGKYVVDLKSRQLVWSLEGRATVAGAHTGKIWAILSESGRSSSTSLVSADLPNPAMIAGTKAAIASAVTLLRAGSKVTLEVSVDATEEQTKKITDAITADLKKSGYVVADGQPVKVIVRTEDGKTTQQSYRQFGAFRGPGEQVTTVSVTEKISRVYVESEGKIAWESKTLNTPGFVQRKENQSIADAVADANKPNLQFFQSVHVPAYIATPRELSTLGKSTWTSAGLKD